ncbi:hypothetical protein SKM57_06415 [Acinetobacter faecalis]|uniref:hypothetical protein n=1 Tax=Acinetobacter faecalis TaxID=2665161 RepID=UPI002A91A6F2|nr:hypothetical protein [Acinetobacter faecalis]MDY6468218.1 hypothetical protein [Acinetobacter faecalis]
MKIYEYYEYFKHYEYYEYYINVYSVTFTLLVASLSLNSVLLIKSKVTSNVNRILLFFIFSGWYAVILGHFFSYARIGYTQQEFLPTFIYKGYSASLFRGSILPLISVVANVIFVIRMFLKWKSYKKQKMLSK